VVCLPGGPLRAATYLGDLGGLSGRHSLALVGLRADSVANLVNDVENVRGDLGLERVQILAHSAAGNLALLYAAAHPDRVAGLVLVTPNSRVVGIHPSDAELMGSLDRRAREPWYPQARAAIEAWAAGDTSFDTRLRAAPFFYGRWDAAAQQHAASESSQTRPDAANIYYAEHVPAPETTCAHLASVDAPVLIIVGEFDLPPFAIAHELAALFRHAEVITQPAAGHYPWLDDPQVFTDTVSAFLDRHRSKPGYDE
jgi:pimeloyl-ACP methyl ester carboxylesterase